MGTRSTIAIKGPSGRITSIYCHWDGYPSHNGKILAEHYTDAAKVKRLMKVGDLSSLGAEIGEKHSFDYRDEFRAKYSVPGKPFEVNYEAMEADPEYQRLSAMCQSYGRDRGEGDTKSTEYASPEEFWAAATEGWCEWAYLFMDGEWLVSEIGGACGPFLVKRSDPDGQAPVSWVRLADLSFDKRPGEDSEPYDGRYSEVRAAANCRVRTRVA